MWTKATKIGIYDIPEPWDGWAATFVAAHEHIPTYLHISITPLPANKRSYVHAHIATCIRACVHTSMHQIIDNDIGTDTCIHVYIDNALINHWYTYVFFNVFHLRCYNCILIIPRRRRDDNAIKDQLREAGGVWLMNHACHMDFYLVCKCPHI